MDRISAARKRRAWPSADGGGRSADASHGSGLRGAALGERAARTLQPEVAIDRGEPIAI